MKKKVVMVLLGIWLVYPALTTFPMDGQAVGRPRVVILTDISNEPDDQQSLVRFLSYANEFQIEGLIATTSCWRKTNPDTPAIMEVLNAYEAVHGNLSMHAEGFPPADSLRSVTMTGVDGFGMGAAIGQLDNEGIEHIISVLDKPDPRPVWFCVWGGANTLGGAVMKLQRERGDEVEALISKIRGYEIAIQDDGFAWIARHYPGVQLISARLLWKGISRTTESFNAWSESWGGDNSLFSPAWVQKNIQSHGTLGQVYPDAVYLWEGDSPSFLYLIPNGLSDPEKPHWGCWGGRFESARSRNVRTGSGSQIVDPLLALQDDYAVFTDARDRWNYDGRIFHNEYCAVFRWREAYQNDFAARMDWSVTSEFSGANHNPIAILNRDSSGNAVIINSQPGDSIVLSAEGTRDPDGDDLDIRWWIYEEAGTLDVSQEIKPESRPSLSNASGMKTEVRIPEAVEDGSIHVIMEVEDAGEPSLFSYRRAVISVGSAAVGPSM